MRRLPPAVLALFLLAAACGGSEVALPSPSAAPTSTAPSPPASFAPSPTASPRPIPPAWARPIRRPIPAEDLPADRLVPPGARATGTWIIPPAAGIPDQVVVTWSTGTDVFQQEHGLALWQRFPDRPWWSVVYAFLDEVGRGVLGIRVQLGDLTGDGHDDVLSFEDQGGSGGCGVWRVLAFGETGVAELYRRHTCDTSIAAKDGALVVTESVYEPGDAHCCPSATRTTTLRWDGAAWQIMARETTKG